MPAPVRAMTLRASRIQPAMVARSGPRGCSPSQARVWASARRPFSGLPGAGSPAEPRAANTVRRSPDGNREQLVGAKRCPG